MPPLNSPQAQGAWVCLPCGLQRAIPGCEAVLAGHVSRRDRVSKSLIDLSPSSRDRVSFMFRGDGNPLMAVSRWADQGPASNP